MTFQAFEVPKLNLEPAKKHSKPVPKPVFKGQHYGILRGVKIEVKSWPQL